MEKKKLQLLFDESVKLERCGEDFYIKCGEERCRLLYNCKNVSAAFLKDFLQFEKEQIWEQLSGDGLMYMEIDMRQELDDAIKDDAWNWRNQVKEYVGNEELS